MTLQRLHTRLLHGFTAALFFAAGLVSLTRDDPAFAVIWIAASIAFLSLAVRRHR
jgi:hypothetical protein